MEKKLYQLKCSATNFTADELTVLQQVSHMLQSHAARHTFATNGEEENFVKLAGELYSTPPTNNAALVQQATGQYAVYLKYLSILIAEGNAPEINKRIITAKKKREAETRADKFSTDQQENRFKN
jgi:hypothetical protein